MSLERNMDKFRPQYTTRQRMAPAIAKTVWIAKQSHRRSSFQQMLASDAVFTPLQCVDPEAQWVDCVQCGKLVKTCDRKESSGSNYVCPAHPDGVELADGGWCCSYKCYRLLRPANTERIV